MKKTLAIGLVILVSISASSGCIGQDEDETGTEVTVRSVEIPEPGDSSGTMPSESPPQSPPFPGGLEEPTPEEEEEAKRIALEDERVQDLIQDGDYELEVIGCMVLNDEKHCMLLLELENGEKYTIIVNMSEGIVEQIMEGEGGLRGGEGGSGQP